MGRLIRFFCPFPKDLSTEGDKIILNFSSIIKIDSALQVDMKNLVQQVNYLRLLSWKCYR